MYEAYAQGGVAVLVECLTDNRNRANAEVRTAITRNGGNPADPGSVSYLFNRKGIVLVTKTDGLTEDDLLLAVLDAGAEEVNDLGEAFEVVCDATDTHAVRLACTDAGLTVDSAEIAWMPTVSVPLDDDVAVKVLKLVDALEDLDDVQNVYANFDISDEVLERVG
jgi:YebC/PmpR family DNA-binding regulatory protein